MVIADYFTEDGLLKQVGLVKEYWNRIVVKELTDNALDAIEPLQDKKVFMDVTSGSLGIYDNGTGIKKETVEDIYDFENYVSQNRNYITASRGKQGNGLKTIISICYIQGYRLLWHTAEGMIYENEDGTFFIGKGRKKTYATYEEAVDIICGRNKKRIENEIEKSLGKIPMCAHEAMLKWDVRAAV